MSKDEGKREIIFQMTMRCARELTEKGLLSKEEYAQFDTRMQQKWEPKIGGLFTDINLL